MHWTMFVPNAYQSLRDAECLDPRLPPKDPRADALKSLVKGIENDRLALLEFLCEGGTSWIFAGYCSKDRQRVVVKLQKTRDELSNPSAQRYLSAHPYAFLHEGVALRTIKSSRLVHILRTGVHKGRTYELLHAPSHSGLFPTVKHLCAHEARFPRYSPTVPPHTLEDQVRITRQYVKYAVAHCDAVRTSCSDPIEYPQESFIDSGRVVPHLIREILLGLKDIHDAGYLHRDLKPDNIILRFNSSPQWTIDALIGDLQTAVVFNGETYDGLSFGSENYSSPEQLLRASGRAVPVGPTSDIYSAGLTIAQLLDPTITTAHLPTVMERLDEGGFTRRIDALLARFHPDHAVFMRRFLAYNPRERYQNLDDALAQSAVFPCHPQLGYPPGHVAIDKDALMRCQNEMLIFFFQQRKE